MGLLRRGICALLMSGIAVAPYWSSRLTADDVKPPSAIDREGSRGWFDVDGVLSTQSPIQITLRQWETASRRLKPLSEFQRKHAVRIYEGRYSPHELSVAIDFHAPVKLSDLNKRFRWTVIGRRRNGTRLAGVPRDDVERLFFKRFELVLDAGTHLPREIHFVQGNGKRRPESLDFALSETDPRPIRRTAAVAGKGGIVPALFPRGDHPAREPDGSFTPPEVLREPVGDPAQLDRFLKLWCARLMSVSAGEANVSHYVYDAKHRIEFRGVGRLRYQSPNQINLEIVSRGIKRGDRSSKHAAAASRLAPEGTNSLVLKCEGGQAMLIDRLSGRYIWGTVDRRDPRTIAGTASPFLWRFDDEPVSLLDFAPIFLGSNQSELRRLYSWRVVREDNTSLWLVATPKSLGGRGWYQQMKVIVNKATKLPEVVQTTDAAGSFETMYVFDKWKITPKTVMQSPVQPPQP